MRTRQLVFLFTALLLAATPPLAPESRVAAQAAGPRLTLTAARVSDDFIPEGSSDALRAGARASFSLIVEQDGAAPVPVEATLELPQGFGYLPETLRVNGLPAPAEAAVLSANGRLRLTGLSLPAAQGAGEGNLAGIHVFFSPEPSLEEIDRRLEWAARLVGQGGTIKLFLPGLTEHTSEAPYWMVHAVRQVYALGLRPVVRLGYANGDASSFTRKWDDGVGQMSRADAAGGYWAIGWATRQVAAHLLAATADVAAGAPSGELTLIVGNEPNLEWVERDWFIDYSYVRRDDGSFDEGWLTADPADPNAKANNAAGWKLFVRGIPGADGAEPGYDARLDDYTRYMGYDAAVEYARFLRTTSGLLQELESPRLLVAGGAIASGGGDLEGRYAYHQRHFIRRMLREVPDALSQLDLWTTNNYPYTLPPWDNYHSRPADFDAYPLGEPFWHTEIGIDSYQGDLDYLAYLQRQGLAQGVPTRAIIGEVGYGVGEGWGTDFGGPPLTEDLRAQYMADIFERYYNGWRAQLAQVNLWQLGDPEHERPTFHMFDMVFPDSASVDGWPTHRHLVYDAVATRASRPGPGRLIVSFEARIDPELRAGYVEARAQLLPEGAEARYILRVDE
jgi:hypothetical protein